MIGDEVRSVGVNASTKSPTPELNPDKSAGRSSTLILSAFQGVRSGDEDGTKILLLNVF